MSRLIPDVKNSNYVYIYSVLLGLLVGTVAIAFSHLLHWITFHVQQWNGQGPNLSVSLSDRLHNITQPWGRTQWLILLVPALGGLLSGLITFGFSKEMSGSGMEYLVHGYHFRDGHIRPRNAWVKAMATIFTVGSGGSGGKEGPVAVIGASIGVWLSELLKTGKKARRTFLLAGAAGGLGSVFKAPLGGALTTVEMVYTDDIESEALIPCFLSSVSAFLLYTSYAGTDKLFTLSGVRFELKELGYYALLGLFCFAFGALFLAGYRTIRGMFRKKRWPLIVKPALGGLITGAVSLLFFEVSGMGEDVMQELFNGKYPLFAGLSYFELCVGFLLLALLKVLTTSCTIGSGGSAGIFGPSLFIGAMLGGSVGMLAMIITPDWEINVISYMVVGMGAFYAGVASASLAGIVMICEITGNYVLLPPLILVTIFTRVISRRIPHLKSQLKDRFEAPMHNTSD